jgi:hypothetical protein
MLGHHIHDEYKQEKATTIRPSSTALLCVDSADRFATIQQKRGASLTNTPYKFSITRNNNIFNGFFKRIALTEIVFPYYIPNINKRTKYLFYESSITGADYIELPDVNIFLTPDELAAVIETEMQAKGVTGITCDYIQGNFQFDAQVGNTIRFIPFFFLPDLPSSTDFQLFDLIGLTNLNTIAAQEQSGVITRCRYTEYIDIVCSQLTYNQDLKDASSSSTTKDILARIYVETENDQPIGVVTTLTPVGEFTNVENTIPGCYPFTIYRQFANPKQIQWRDTQPIGNLTFEVYDDNGNLLSDLSGEDLVFPDWRMTLLVSED